MFWHYAVSKRRKPPVDVTALDTESEVIEAIHDLDSAKRGVRDSYWPKIRERLLQLSSSDDIEEAKREWEDDGLPYYCEGGTCELCDKVPIKYRFPIKNRVTHKKLVVGSECIYNYLQIDGYEGPEELRRKLVAQLNLLKSGETEGLRTVGEVFQTESKVRRMIVSVAGGEPDLNPEEYRDALYEVVHVCNHLGIKNSTAQASQQVLVALSKAIKFATVVRAKQKVLGPGLGAIASALVARRRFEDRLSALDEFLRLLNSIAQFGPAKDVLARAWGVVDQRRDDLLDLITKKCDVGKAQLESDYRFELDMASPYRNLRVFIEAGVKSQRDFFDSQVDAVRKALEADNFIELVQKGSVALTNALNSEFYPDLMNSDDAAQRAAAQVCSFINIVTNGDIHGVTSAIEGVYHLSGIRDLAGVKIAMLRAANDSIIDADVAGKGAVADFEQLVNERDKKVLELVGEEVDEVAELIKKTSGMRVYEKMGTDLDIDVQATFKRYSSKVAAEKSFCSGLFKQWEDGGLRSLAPSVLTSIRKQLLNRRSEVPDSMWQDLKSELMAKYSIL